MSKIIRIPLLSLGIACSAVPAAHGARGLFPKMPPAASLHVFDCQNEDRDAKMTALALEGLVNRSSAEVYLIENPLHRAELEDLRISYSSVQGGVPALFHSYRDRIQKLFVYDPAREWTWFLAMMAGAQQNGIPVTEAVMERLLSQEKWNGEVEDFRDRWPGRIEAYDWAIKYLMPGCSRSVIETQKVERPNPASIVDYIVASKGFAFALDYTEGSGEEREIEKIFRAGHYSVGASLMGYSGDDANMVANRYGIGYVVSGFFANGSYWSSSPPKTYQGRQAPGHAARLMTGVVYVTLGWSDGDNIAIDQNTIYSLWHDPARGKLPVGTTLGPGFQELDPKLLDWFYRNMTENDELGAGPSGFQFIYVRQYNERLFPAWCKLNREWLADAGFLTGCMWRVPYPSQRYRDYVESCGLRGIFWAGQAPYGQPEVIMDGGVPAVPEGTIILDEDALFNRLASLRPNASRPTFAAIRLGSVAFNQNATERGGGYTKVKRQVDRIQAMYPDRFVFLLPKDFFATIRVYKRGG